ncbi:hypothetical protein K7X08_006852 [Anisodus acutangulus]|uniref:Uncharacterized protein n=1 Tax=Anisodus acutangulus TaxID=402998 RepID=A0A9Q1LCT0_9SOLA|nr:hypothetical protein K7X08_006852 [Anisodus acutangulus]
MNTKLQELKLDEDVTQKISNLLVDSSDSNAESEPDYFSLSSEDNKALQIDELLTTSSSEYSDKGKGKLVCVLTKDQEFMLEMVQHIDVKHQKDYLYKLLKSFTEEKKDFKNLILPNTSKNTYDLTKILKKGKGMKESKETPILELQKDVKQIKVEIKALREKQDQNSLLLKTVLSKAQDNSESSSESDNSDSEDPGEPPDNPFVEEVPPQTPSAPLQTKEHTQFLSQKSQMTSMLAAAKNPEEMQAIILKFAPSSSKQGSSSEEEEPEIDIKDSPVFGNSGF